MGQRILVTGAGGYIGSHVAERLATLGHAVTGIDCLTDYYSRQQKELNVQAIQARGASFHKIDLAEDDLAPISRSADLVIHLAAQPGISAKVPFGDYLRNNLIASQRLLEHLERRDQPPGLIYISTSSVYGSDASGDETTEPKPTSYYGVTKLAAEQLILARFRDKGYPACSLRLFSVYGPRERPDKLYPRLISAALSGAEFPLYEGSWEHVRSYTYVGDIVDGIQIVVERFQDCIGEIFNIGTEASYTTGEGIRLVEEIIGRKVKIVVKPRRPGDQKSTQANIQKARALLGYDPQTSLRDGLEQTVAWYKSHSLDYAHLG